MADPDRASSSGSAITVRNALKIYVAAFWLLTIIAACIVGISKFVLHKPDTHVLHFCCREDEFSDFTFLSQRVAHFRDPDMLYLKRASGLALGGLIKALILLILLLTVLLVPMPSSFFADLCLPASDPKTEA